jgi:hypothetical protein
LGLEAQQQVIMEMSILLVILLVLGCQLQGVVLDGLYQGQQVALVVGVVMQGQLVVLET